MEMRNDWEMWEGEGKDSRLPLFSFYKPRAGLRGGIYHPAFLDLHIKWKWLLCFQGNGSTISEVPWVVVPPAPLIQKAAVWFIEGSRYSKTVNGNAQQGAGMLGLLKSLLHYSYVVQGKSGSATQDKSKKDFSHMQVHKYIYALKYFGHENDVAFASYRSQPNWPFTKPHPT